MHIKKITKLKNDKYKIKLDDEDIITYDGVIIQYNLLYKKDIDSTLYNQIINSTKYYDNYDKALKYALKKIRSKHEMKDYLSKMDISVVDQYNILDKLIELKIVNDLVYTRALINDRMALGKVGIKKIISELEDNEIDQDIIGEELSKIDVTVFDDKLEKLIIKKINGNHKYSNSYLSKKIINDMLNLGYDLDMINEYLDKHLKGDYDILLQEYKKQYTKLSKKYNGNELVFKIKNNLFNKGFNYDDIKKEDLL